MSSREDPAQIIPSIMLDLCCKGASHRWTRCGSRKSRKEFLKHKWFFFFLIFDWPKNWVPRSRANSNQNITFIMWIPRQPWGMEFEKKEKQRQRGKERKGGNGERKGEGENERKEREKERKKERKKRKEKMGHMRILLVTPPPGSKVTSVRENGSASSSLSRQLHV